MKQTPTVKVSTIDTTPLRGLKNSIKLIFSQKVINQVQLFCKEVPSLEWSGPIFYTCEEISNDTVITLHEIFLMDIGSPGYTEYDYSSEVIGFKMENPHILDMREGNIHSHNNMSVFFSGTDNNDLRENTLTHNFYLSVIVNNAFDVSARLAFRGEVEESSELKIKYRENEENRLLKFPGTKAGPKVFFYQIEDIDFEEYQDERFNELNSKRKERTKLINTTYPTTEKFIWEMEEDNLQLVTEFLTKLINLDTSSDLKIGNSLSNVDLSLASESSTKEDYQHAYSNSISQIYTYCFDDIYNDNEIITEAIDILEDQYDNYESTQIVVDCLLDFLETKMTEEYAGV